MEAPSNYDNWEEQMDRTHKRICKENMRYAMFRAHKSQLSSHMIPEDYLVLANTVSLQLVFYDPNFDFGSQKPLPVACTT